jgi:hypothetical protein
MSELPLFYSSIVPLDSAAHRNHRVGPARIPYGYAMRAHLIPAVVDEFGAAAREIPVVFAPAGKRFAAVFLCGLKPGRNLFVDQDGRWNGAYVPAYLRRFPFMLGEREGADPVVCIDTSFDGFGTEGAGDRLFDDEGQQSPQLAGMIRLITDFAQSAKRTETLGEVLAELGLLKGVTIDVQQPGAGPSASIHGLLIVDEQKLNELPEESFNDLRRRGFLGAIYAHLFSVGATQNLAGKLQALDAATAQAAA